MNPIQMVNCRKALVSLLMLFFLPLYLATAQNATQTTSEATPAKAQADESKGDSVRVVPAPKPRPSTMAVAFYKDDNIYIKVVYSQPLKKNRDIFASIAPYGKLWRTGANEATEITFTRDVRLGGKTVRAGTYTLFTIPNPDKWTIILNTDLGQWGEYKYDAAKNELSFDVPAEKNKELYEAFTIKFSESKAGADMTLLWDNVQVVVPITFTR